MRRARYGRRAISDIIAGMIVLILLLTALGTMVFITQQYDAYQSTLNTLAQEDTERLSESIIPGSMSNQSVTCGGVTCNQYTMTLNNDGPIEVQIARIYINSTSGCTKLCTFDPSNSPTPFTFELSAAFINPGDSSHSLAFWLPSNMQLPARINANTISLVTSRGRVFSFQWEVEEGLAVPSELRFDAGALSMIYDANLITLTDNGSYNVPGPLGCANNYPSATACYSPGLYSQLPYGRFVFYVRISNIGGAPVTLLDRSYLLAEGSSRLDRTQMDFEQFYIVEPMSQQCHDAYFESSDFEKQYGGWPSDGNCPTPSTVQPYNASYPLGQCNLSNPCYQLPSATLGVPGPQTYVLFSAQTAKGDTCTGYGCALKQSYDYFLYLELSYIYLGYEYSISVPLIAVNT